MSLIHKLLAVLPFTAMLGAFIWYFLTPSRDADGDR